jgi:hypothetical protein
MPSAFSRRLQLMDLKLNALLVAAGIDPTSIEFPTHPTPQPPVPTAAEQQAIDNAPKVKTPEPPVVRSRVEPMTNAPVPMSTPEPPKPTPPKAVEQSSPPTKGRPRGRS